MPRWYVSKGKGRMANFEAKNYKIGGGGTHQKDKRFHFHACTFPTTGGEAIHCSLEGH